MRTIEICAGSVADVIAARLGGASRVELCSALAEGGVTPSAGLIVGAVRERGEMLVHVLIRPRPGNFVYTPLELNVMMADIAAAKEAGADGIAVGVLTADGKIDKEAMKRIMIAAAGMNVTFHRAFDETADPLQALEDLCSLGICRVLTSGAAEGAPAGLPMLRQLVEHAKDRIIVMPGAGINPSNIATIEKATGAAEFHSSATDKNLVTPTSRLFGEIPHATSSEIVRKLVES